MLIVVRIRLIYSNFKHGFKFLQQIMGSPFNGLLPKSLFTLSKTFFDQSKACSRRFENSPAGSDSSKRLSSTSPRLMSKNVLMTVQKDLGNSPLKGDPSLD